MRITPINGPFHEKDTLLFKESARLFNRVLTQIEREERYLLTYGQSLHILSPFSSISNQTTSLRAHLTPMPV